MQNNQEELDDAILNQSMNSIPDEEPEPEQAFVQDFEPEPEQEEEQQEEPEAQDDSDYHGTQSKNKPSIKTRINQIQREKYRALEMARQKEEENEYLKRQLLEVNSKAEESSNAAMAHYDNNVNLRLENAKKQKAIAIETGDVQSQVNADVELAEATNELQQIRSWKAEQAIQNQQDKQRVAQEEYYRQNAPAKTFIPDTGYAYQWAEDNDWYVPNSENYNPQLASMVHSYSDQLENYCLQNGLGNKILSPEYFNEIDNYVRNVTSQNQSNSRRDLNMKPSRAPVSPVRNNMNYVASQKGKGSLTADQRDLAKRIGVSEEVYRKHMAMDAQKQKFKQGQY